MTFSMSKSRTHAPKSFELSPGSCRSMCCTSVASGNCQVRSVSPEWERAMLKVVSNLGVGTCNDMVYRPYMSLMENVPAYASDLEKCDLGGSTADGSNAGCDRKRTVTYGNGYF